MLALGVTAASRKPGRQFFKGKTINLYIGFNPGGSYDYFGRLAARYMGKHIPGNPNIVAQSMPGAGSLQAANFMYRASAEGRHRLGGRDADASAGGGAEFARGALQGRRIQLARAADLDRRGVLHVEASKAKTIEDATRHETPMAGTGVGSPSEGYPRLLNAFAGTRFKIISGYTSSSQGLLRRARRGRRRADVMEHAAADQAQLARQPRRQHCGPVHGDRAARPLARRPDLAGGRQDPEGRQALEFYVSGARSAARCWRRPACRPSGCKLLRQAFEAMIKDPEVIAEVDRSGQEFQPGTGEQVEKLIRGASSAPPRCRASALRRSCASVRDCQRRISGRRAIMSLSVVPLSPALGAEIKGVDLRKPLDAGDRPGHQRRLRPGTSWWCSAVRTCPRTTSFAPPAISARSESGAGRPTAARPGGDCDTPFMMVTNIVENGKPIGAFGDGEMWFHHDTSYTPEPHRARRCCIRMKITSSGGQTCFSNMYRAYDNIPRALRDRLKAARCCRCTTTSGASASISSKVDVNAILHHEQPIFITHPATGAEGALRQPADVGAHRGLVAEARAKPRSNSCSTSPKIPSIIYEHDWRLGDLVIWDNWCSIHVRKDFPAPRAAPDAPADHRRPGDELLMLRRCSCNEVVE